MNIVVFDTETVNLDKPFCYNVGYAIYNTDTDEIIVKRDFVIEQVWHNPMLFITAYYADKREIYVNRLRGRRCVMDKFGYVMRTMYRDLTDNAVQHGFAYNSPFDVKVFEFNCDWFKCINPLDTIQVHDIRGYVNEKIALTDCYKAYCEAHSLFTESGNYSTTAEAVYRFVKNDEEFVEEHTALADTLIELEILNHCVGLGCEYGMDYKVSRTIPRIVQKEFEVIDHNGTSHKFPYTAKRKISKGDGVRLTLDRQEG